MDDNQKSPYDRFEEQSLKDDASAGSLSEEQDSPSPEVGEGNAILVMERFEHCSAKRVTCVVDGDTIWLNGVKIRVADIDTPEVSEPKCAYEKALGDRATARLLELLNVGPFELEPSGPRDADRYGRKLRSIKRNGRSLGDQLVDEGLARKWTGRRLPWC